MPERYVLYSFDEIGACAAYEDVFITVLRRPVSLESLRDIRRAAARHALVWKGKGRSINVIEPQGMRLFVPEPIRRESSQMTNDFPVTATANVIEGAGFGVAAMRSFVAGLYLIDRKVSAQKIFGDVVSAAKWLAPPSGGAKGASHADLIHAIERARSAITAAPA